MIHSIGCSKITLESLKTIRKHLEKNINFLFLNMKKTRSWVRTGNLHRAHLLSTKSKKKKK